MFNGIIKNTGIIHQIDKNKNYFNLVLKSKVFFSRKEIGSSISCSGVCLTLINFKKNLTTFYLSKETLSKSNFKYLNRGSLINIEKSMKFGDRISGHFVQGHVDTVCSIKKILVLGKSWFINFNMSKKYRKLIVQKGSIAINGVSLTISRVLKNGFQIAVIPKTLQLTNLIKLKKKDFVNVEFDVLGKYINKSLKKL